MATSFSGGWSRSIRREPPTMGKQLFFLSAKPEIAVPGSGIPFRYFLFEIFGKLSFVEAVLWRAAQFFYLPYSKFRQQASCWINKTLLLIKQQKWLSEFCVKIDRIVSKNYVRIADKKKVRVGSWKIGSVGGLQARIFCFGLIRNLK